jgi:RimJ/RimL family protein N-acetyltransferase
MTPRDATKRYVSWWSDPEITTNLGLRPQQLSVQQAVNHIRSFDNRTNFLLGIFPKGKTIPIGTISILAGDQKRTSTDTIIGEKSYWGKKVPLEIRAAVIDFIFSNLDVHKICGVVDGRNFATIFNYKAQGFACEGVLREHLAAVDGTRHDQLHFGLLRHEWLAAGNGSDQS